MTSLEFRENDISLKMGMSKLPCLLLRAINDRLEQNLDLICSLLEFVFFVALLFPLCLSQLI